jgi:hypothetical protein
MFFVSPCLNSFGKIEEFPEDKQNIQIPAKFVPKSKAQILVEKNKKKKKTVQMPTQGQAKQKQKARPE